MSAEIITNERGQKVRHYTWENYKKRLGMRKEFTKDTDLNDKTLVINHTWGLGDILYLTPALYGLKKKFPRSTLIFICRFPSILEGNPYVDRVIHFLDYDTTEDLYDKMEVDWYYLDYDSPLKGGLDYKINLRTRPQLNEFMVSLLRKSPSELNADENDFVRQASHSVIQRYKHIALDTYCQHAHIGPEDMTREERTVYYYPTELELKKARAFLEGLRQKTYKIITLLPHASTQYKDYPHWKEVIRLCPKNYFWLIMDSHIRKDEPWFGPNMANLSGAFTLRDSAAIIIEADLNCSSDTGLLYPKAARGGNCVVTYGPHEPEPFLEYFPSAHGLRIGRLLYTEGMIGMCSTGCFIDTESCHIKGKPAPCLQELPPEVVAGKIMELLCRSNS
jgi:ADP-heptose:LPS heptosyltransferase